MPGITTDLAPGWLLEQATSYSKSEFQRVERVSRSTIGADGAVQVNAKGGGKSKGEGKDKGRAKGKGKGKHAE